MQTVLLNLIRYKTWDKERTRNPLLTCLPLWTRDKLAQGCVSLTTRFCPGGGCNLSTSTAPCCKVYRISSPNLSHPLAVYPNARTLLEEHYSEEDTVQPSPEDALEMNTFWTQRSTGYAARDAFGAVFDIGR